MSQNSILEILEKNKGIWYNANELCKLLKIAPNSCRANLRRLRNFNLIESKLEIIPKKQSIIYYRWKYNG